MAKGNGFNALSLLNQKSKKQAEHEKAAAEENKGSFEVEMIDVYDLVPSEENFYSIDEQEVRELAVSIELLGRIQQNLVVKPPVHGKREVIAGHKRRLAALLLVEEGKEQFRYVPCITETDSTKDKLRLILTNSTQRELNDWEKVQQYKELKTALEEYRKQLDMEAKQAKEGNGWLCETCEYFNRVDTDCIHEKIQEEEKNTYFTGHAAGCPFYEKLRLGRTRELISETLHLSNTQLARYEKIDNGLKEEFKEELKAGNINISVAHEIAKKPQEEQEKIHEEYKQSGELHIKDVAQEPQKPQQAVAEEQAENVKAVVREAVKGEINREVFKNLDPVAVTNTLKRFFYQSYKGGKAEPEGGEQFVYRFSPEGVNLVSKDWQNYLVSYENLALIILSMIDTGEIQPEPENETQAEEERGKDSESREEEQEAAEEEQEATEEGSGAEQDNIMNHPEYMPEIEPGLGFSEWIERKNGRGQREVIGDIIRKQFIEISTNSFSDLQKNIIAAVNEWFTVQSREYEEYLKG